MACVHKFGSELQSVSARVYHVETRIREFATTINLVDAHDTRDEEMEAVKTKNRFQKEQLEDKGGSPKSIQQSDLRDYVTKLFTSNLPDLPEID